MLVQISHRNLVNKDLISAVLYPKGNAFKRLRDNAIENGLLIDCKAGRKTRDVIVLTTGQVVLSALNPEKTFFTLLMAAFTSFNGVCV